MAEEVKVRYHVDRDQAVLAGKAFFGPVETTVDLDRLTPEEREELVKFGFQDGAYDIGPRRRVVGTDYGPVDLIPPKVIEPDDEVPYMMLRHAVQERARLLAEAEKKAKIERANREAERKALHDEIMALTPDELFARFIYKLHTPNTIQVGESLVRWSNQCVKHKEGGHFREDELRTECQRRNAEEKAKAQAAADEMESKRLERLERRALQITKWVQTHGTDSQKKRHSVRLLPEAEVLDGIRSLTFACLDEFPRYRKIKADDVASVCTCYDERVEYSTNPATDATESEYERMEKIREVLLAAGWFAEVSLELHTGQCPGCDAFVECKAVRVELRVGEFNFSRLYAVPPDVPQVEPQS